MPPRTISSMYIPHPKHRFIRPSFARSCSSRVPSLLSHAVHLLADSKPSRQPSHPPSSFTPPRTPPITAAGTWNGRPSRAPELSWTSDVAPPSAWLGSRAAPSRPGCGTFLRKTPPRHASFWAAELCPPPLGRLPSARNPAVDVDSASSCVPEWKKAGSVSVIACVC